MLLGEYSNQLIGRSYRIETGVMLQVMIHKMTINLDIFSELMKHIIMVILNDTLIITIDRIGNVLRCRKVM
jgi:hypothetical protein